MPQENKKKRKEPKEDDDEGSWRKDIIEIVLFLGIAVLIVFGFNWFLGLILHTNSPLVVVTTESMEPTYWGSNRPGYGGTSDVRKDMLIVRGVDPSKIQVGDTIVFESTIEGDTPIVHRVTAIYYNESTGEYWFTTKGDNNETFITGMGVEELTIHEDRLIGKVIGRIPFLGGLIKYLQSRTGQIVLIVIVVVILVASIVWSLRPEKDEAIFDEEEESEEKEVNTSSSEQNEDEESSWNKIKRIYQFYQKRRQIIIPAVILTVVILIPIIDTLASQWGTEFGATGVSYTKVEEHSLPAGNYWYVFADVTINNPGFRHQRFQKFTLSVIDQNSGEVLGEGVWTIVYNFEGTKLINFGVWVEDGLMSSGQTYDLVATAFLQNKFGKSWNNTIAEEFTFPV